jgi:16S rRNA U1498 N3-methylase RsmE
MGDAGEAEVSPFELVELPPQAVTRIEAVTITAAEQAKRPVKPAISGADSDW